MEKQKPKVSVPLAKRYSLKELRGSLGKQMTVPEGRQGVRILRDGQALLFPPGTHKVLNGFQRLQGLGGGLLVGYVPADGLQLHFKVSHVLSGDGQLLDLSLLGDGRVSDSVRFMVSEVLPRKVILGPALELDEEPVFEAVYQLIHGYESEDLLSGDLTGDLRNKLQTILAASLKSIGLEMCTIDLVTIWRAEDSLKIEEALFSLEQKMDELELEKRMSAVETQAQFNEFMREYVPDWPDTSGMPQIHLQETPEKTGNALLFWIKSENREDQPGRNFRLKALWKQKKTGEAPKTEHQRAKKLRWVPRVIWMVFVIILGVSISLVFRLLAKAVSWDNQLEFFVVVGTFVVGALLESIAALYRQWEENQSTEWSLEGATLLDDLSRNNRQLVDRIVREQCAAELDEQHRMVNDTRSRVYLAGNQDLALHLRRLEGKLIEAKGYILDSNFGTAPYLLSELKINKRAWERMLDDDEHILVQAAALSEDAHGFQTRLSKKELDGNFVNRFEEKVDVFQKDFASRQRVLRTGEKDLEIYRMLE